MISLIILPKTPSIPSRLKSTNTIGSPQPSVIRINQEPLENDSLPFLSLENEELQLGDRQIVFFGMLNSNQSQFIAGYNYSLMLIPGNILEPNNVNITMSTLKFLQNGTTKDGFETFEINTLGDTLFTRLAPGNHTVFFQVNSVNRGSLNATSTFEIIVLPGVEMRIEFKNIQTGSISSVFDLSINQTVTFAFVITNSGSINAFNISVDISRQDEPLGLSNTNIPFELGFLESQSSASFNFSVKPDNFGQGFVEFRIQFNDGSGQNSFSSAKFTINVLPVISGRILLNAPNNPLEPIYLNPDDPGHNKIEVTIVNLSQTEFTSITAQFRLVSDSMSFLPPSYPLDPGQLSNYIFTITSLEPGTVEIKLLIEFLDLNGENRITQELNVQIFTVTKEISEDPSKGNGNNGITISKLLPGIAIALYLITMIAGFVILSNPNLRDKLLRRFFKLKFVSDIDFDNKKVIVDGSNIAWEQKNQRNKPKLSNVALAIDTLKEYGFKDITVVADAALRYQIENKEELDKASKSGKIKVLPARVEADGFILRLSVETGALILTNDLFKEYLEEFPWIEERRIPYSILRKKLYLHPTFSQTQKQKSK